MTEQLQQDDVAADRRGISIDVDQLSRQVRLRNRNQLTLLDAVSFTVSAGGLVTIVGPSGAGKTTLLEAIAGIAPATSGSVRSRVGRRFLATSWRAHLFTWLDV